ncbi:hypothetical protein [Micrococcus sp. IITD107]|uniref:hypothetical protein n=1 Tax=Micrococcus sp. IITD107 TaxID=3342790 RepID=UPI0035BA1EE7
MPRRPTPRIAPLDTNPSFQPASQDRPDDGSLTERSGRTAGEGQDYDLFGEFDESDQDGQYGEQTWASQQAAGAPRWAKWLLYGSMALGLLAAGLLIATVVIQSLVSGSLAVGGADFFADTPQSAELRRELLWGPVTLPLVALGVAFVGLCVGGLTIFRYRRAR